MTDQSKEETVEEEDIESDSENDEEDDTSKNDDEQDDTEDSEDDSEEDSDEEDSDDDKDSDDVEVPVRGSAAHIIARQKRTIQKLRSKSNEDEDDEVIVDDEEEDLTPKAKSEMSRMLDERLGHIEQSLVSKADEEELTELFKSEPEAKKYEKRIRAYMKHEQYRGVPPTVIFHHLNYQSAETTGAKKKNVADIEAKQMGTKGSARRTPTKKAVSADDIENMTDEEFDEFERQQRRRR